MPLALEFHGSCCKISAGFISELVRRITAVTLDRRGCNVKQADMTRACKTGCGSLWHRLLHHNSK